MADMTYNSGMNDTADMTAPAKITIRGLDPRLYRLARIEALREGKTVAQWINLCIRKRLEGKGVKT